MGVEVVRKAVVMEVRTCPVGVGAAVMTLEAEAEAQSQSLEVEEEGVLNSAEVAVAHHHLEEEVVEVRNLAEVAAEVLQRVAVAAVVHMPVVVEEVLTTAAAVAGVRSWEAVAAEDHTRVVAGPNGFVGQSVSRAAKSSRNWKTSRPSLSRPVERDSKVCARDSCSTAQDRETETRKRQSQLINTLTQTQREKHTVLAIA